jgi:hypothetical protein
VPGTSAQIVTGTGTGTEHLRRFVTVRSQSFAKRVGTVPTVSNLCQVMTERDELLDLVAERF